MYVFHHNGFCIDCGARLLYLAHIGLVPPSQIAQQPIATVRIAQSQPHSTLPIATLHIAQSIATVYIAQSIATYLSDKARGSSKALEVWKKKLVRIVGGSVILQS